MIAFFQVLVTAKSTDVAVRPVFTIGPGLSAWRLKTCSAIVSDKLSSSLAAVAVWIVR